MQSGNAFDGNLLDHGRTWDGHTWAELCESWPGAAAKRRGEPAGKRPLRAKAASTTKTACTANDEDNHRAAACRSPISRPTTKKPSYGPSTADVRLRHGGLETAPAERRAPTVRRAVVGREPRVRPHTFGRPFVRVIIIRPPRCGAAAAGPWMQTRARGRAPCRRADRLSGPFHRYGEAPRASRRPPHKARGGNIPGVFDRRATPGAGCIGGRMPAYL